MHHPGPPRFIGVGSTIDLAPRDPDPSAEYEWHVARAPKGSSATLGDAPVEQFTPDVSGTYKLGLDAPDGQHTLTVRVFPTSQKPPLPVDDEGDGTDSDGGDGDGGGSSGGSGLHRSGGVSGGISGGESDLPAESCGGSDDPFRDGAGGRPRIRLDGRVEGDEVVVTGTPKPAPGADVPPDGFAVEFLADDRDPVSGSELTIDGHEVRIDRADIREYSRIHAVAVDPTNDTYSVSDAIAVAPTEEGQILVDRLNEPPAWSRSITLYEIYVRTFADGDEPTFEAIADRLPELAEFGVNCIWLTPVLQNDEFDHGYNITDFFSIADDLGTREEFEALLEEAHDHGIKVLFDLVLNHSAREHEFFGRAKAGDPEYRDWYEWENEADDVPATYFDWPYIANFNFDNLHVRRHLLDVVDEWAPYVDGFRCDMAWAVPTSFWQEIRDRVKSHDREFLLLDETIPYVPEFHELCFDVHFDTTLYHNLRQIGHGEMPARAVVDAIRQRAETGFPDHAGFLQYMENHDETRFLEECGRPETEAAAGAIFTLPGIPLLYAGQEIGERTRRERISWEETDEELRRHYGALNELRRERPAFGPGGAFEPVEVDAVHDGVVAYAREAGEERLVVVLNFAPMPEHVSLPEETVEPTDLVSGGDVDTPSGDLRVESVAVVSTAEPM
ncbi:Glycosidase [Halalkaliarchaeum sp. AArc-CO]|uniref:alpha-amylase MalA n=1 Tax=unclassified Halalkaliarchaeum TaxID=2678344 RepID=UPI0026E58825|nr:MULTISPECIES: alpha-amylase MalA [unclassified Halalkaliarchaeum]MDR5672578.1 alpha-amylase MalA [Halalkaliarchaeum sp. AArc-GB]UWG50469.1 Glycosidase [Halalkaliarchaeum sp. AArc-CO]